MFTLMFLVLISFCYEPEKRLDRHDKCWEEMRRIEEKEEFDDRIRQKKNDGEIEADKVDLDLQIMRR